MAVLDLDAPFGSGLDALKRRGALNIRPTVKE
jgi:hypothetical protein